MTRRLSTLGFAKRFVAPRLPRVAEILDYPQVAPILDRIDANPGAVFVILGAPQIFKTLIGQLRALRGQMLEPAPALWYGKNEATAEQIADEKFNPLFDSCMPTVKTAGKDEPTPALLFSDKYRRTKNRYTLPTGDQLLFLSAGVEINRQSKSASDIYLDESWEFEPGWIKEIQRRRADFARFRELHMMTGPTHGSFACELWEQSTQELWHLRCTKCNRLFPPEIGDGSTPGGLRYDNGPAVRDANGKRILAATRASVALECPHCGAQHPNTAHARAALNARGCFVSMNATPEQNVIGWRCPALPFRDWGDIVIEKIVAERAKRRGDLSLTEDFWRKTDANVWREDVHMAEKKVRPTGDYLMGEEWPDEARDPHGRLVRSAHVDVQLDYYVVVIRAWAANGESRGVWAEKVNTASRIHDLTQAHGVIPERVWLDCRHDPQQIRRIAAQFGWRVMQGDADKDYFHKASGLRRIFSEPRMIDAFAGTQQRGIVTQINFSKQSALSRLHLLRTLTTPDGRPLWTAAKNAPEWYWKEIEAHYRVKETAKDGSEAWVWKGLREDHAGDCEAMAVVFASMAGLIGADSVETEAKAAG